MPVTGITDALMDSIPMVVITGQVPTTLIGTDAFQEADTVGITRHCTKHNYLVKDPARLSEVVHEAFYIATSGRPRPGRGGYSQGRAGRHRHVHASREQPSPFLSSAVEGDPALIAQAVEMIAAAQRPILYTGGGIINAGPAASAALRDLAALTGAPVTSTLMGLGAVPSTDEKFLACSACTARTKPIWRCMMRT